MSRDKIRSMSKYKLTYVDGDKPDEIVVASSYALSEPWILFFSSSIDPAGVRSGPFKSVRKSDVERIDHIE